jgi:hypothetical protein
MMDGFNESNANSTPNSQGFHSSFPLSRKKSQIPRFCSFLYWVPVLSFFNRKKMRESYWWRLMESFPETSSAVYFAEVYTPPSD